MAREKLAADLTEVLNLRPMPAVVLRINEVCQDQQANLQTVLELIQCELSIASSILSVVNSPIYGYSREINSLNQAVVVLGFRKLSELAVSIAAKAVFEAGESSEQVTRIHTHSLACAATARVIAQRCGSNVDAGAAFLSGMLHDIGKLFLHDLAPTVYSGLQTVAGGSALVSQEQDLFGLAHPELGRHFAISQNLPPIIADAITHHHSEGGEDQPELARLIEVANVLTKTWGIGSELVDEENEVAQQWMAEQSAEVIEQVQQESSDQFEIIRKLFMD